MYLLDTVVISELRRKRRDPHVVDWIARQRSSDLFLSVITIGEIERGIAQERSRNPSFAERLGTWLDSILALYSDRILSIETGTARRWGQLSAAIGHGGAGLMIAATALEHGLTVVTRNTRHFEPTGVSVLNPFAPQS